MPKIFKIVLILLVLTSIVSGALAVVAYMGKEREYMKRLLVEDKLAVTLKEKGKIEKELDAVTITKEALEVKVAKIQEEADNLSAQIEKEKQKNETILVDVESKKKELEKAKMDLDTERKEKLSISKRLEEIQLDYDKVKLEVTRLKNEETNLQKKIADLEEKTRSINLDKIVVNTVDANAPAPAYTKPGQSAKSPLQGKVLVVNKDYSFIVTDLGQDKGVQKGMVLEVREGGAVLGKAEIDKVYDTMSSATILSGGRINDMKKGNVVIESR